MRTDDLLQPHPPPSPKRAQHEDRPGTGTREGVGGGGGRGRRGGGVSGASGLTTSRCGPGPQVRRGTWGGSTAGGRSSAARGRGQSAHTHTHRPTHTHTHTGPHRPSDWPHTLSQLQHPVGAGVKGGGVGGVRIRAFDNQKQHLMPWDCSQEPLHL